MAATNTSDRLGVLIVGLGGAVASTLAAGLELIRQGEADRTGLPLASFDHVGLAPYEAIEIAGWDLNPDDLAAAVATHRVLPSSDTARVGKQLSLIKPWPAAGSTAFCRNVDGSNRFTTNSLLGAIEQLRLDIRTFSQRTYLAIVTVKHLRILPACYLSSRPRVV